jgi:hypothetical protein
VGTEPTRERGNGRTAGPRHGIERRTSMAIKITDKLEQEYSGIK